MFKTFIILMFYISLCNMLIISYIITIKIMNNNYLC